MNELINRVIDALIEEIPSRHHLDMEDRDAFAITARAAIKAMLEPTGRMLAAGSRRNSAGDTTHTIWQAMIDEALK